MAQEVEMSGQEMMLRAYAISALGWNRPIMPEKHCEADKVEVKEKGCCTAVSCLGSA
jgi:hypothetical protein